MNSLPPKDITDKKQTKSIHSLIFRQSALLIILTAGLVGLYLLPAVMTRIGNVGVSTLNKTVTVLNKHLSSKEQFSATFGPIISEQKLSRLQFYQRNQVCLFRIIRYRGPDTKNYNYVEFYKKESDKKPLNQLPIFLDQYCEWQAKGTYEFNFYIDMADLSKWNYSWEPERFTLTLYPPDIKANTPAELEPLVYICIADSLSIDESYSKKQLEKEVMSLKRGLAEDQKQFMYEAARSAIKTMYKQFMLNLVPTSAHNKDLPNIIVSFPHDNPGRKVRKM